MAARVVPDPVSGCPLVLPLGRHRTGRAAQPSDDGPRVPPAERPAAQPVP